MKKVSQEEFEGYIKEILLGNLTRVELLKILHIDRVTLNSKIQELYVYNPELYFEFIRKFPYMPRTYTHIDYEAMIIDIMKKGYSKRELKEQYGISDRTIQRKILIIEKENPSLGNLYRTVALYRKQQKPLPKELQQIVDGLESREIFIGGIYDEREKELLEKEKQYQEAKASGISDQKAFGNRRTIKDLHTLYRIEIEQNARNQESIQNKAENKNNEGLDER